MNYDWDNMTPIEEVYAIRHRIAERYGFNLDAIFDAGRKAQREAEAQGVVYNFVKLPIAKPCSCSL